MCQLIMNKTDCILYFEEFRVDLLILSSSGPDHEASLTLNKVHLVVSFNYRVLKIRVARKPRNDCRRGSNV